MRIESRPSMPLKRTVVSRIATIVITAVSGAALTQSQAAGARLRPMSATMAPVTTGGMVTSIQRTPTKWTTSPTRARVTPTEMIPPWAKAMACDSRSSPAVAENPVTAPIGASSPNDEPRYEGIIPFVMSRKNSVPMAVKNSVVDGGNPVSRGTRNVAPNIATTC